MERIIIILKYSERQKYGINSLKIKQNLLDRSILIYKNIYLKKKIPSSHLFSSYDVIDSFF
jgi:hypothetical protein